jgi:hypothetical protein
VIKIREQESRVETKEEAPKKRIAKMPIFNCSCGAKILVVPDLLEMKKAIKNHINEHKKAVGQRITEEALTEEIIRVITEYSY